MGRIFDMNNPVWSTIGKLVDVFVLHFLWLICCIPIVTIGPSTIALYYSLMKTVKDENPHYVKTFFRAFKENLRQGMIMGVILTVMGGLMAYAFVFYSRAGNTQGNYYWQILKIMTIVFSVIYVFILQYAFALMARFENTILQTLKNAFFMSIKNLGWTVLMLVVLVLPYIVIYYTNFIPLFSIAYGLVVFVDSYILNKIFEPYIKALTGDTEEKDPDYWVIDDDVLPERIEEAPSEEAPSEEEKTEESPAEPVSEE